MALVKHKYKKADGTMVESTDLYYRFTYKGKTYFGSTKTANKVLAQKVEDKKKREVIEAIELGISKGITTEQALANWLGTVKHSPQFHNHKTHVSKLLGQKRNTQLGGKTVQFLKVFGFDKNKPFESLTNGDIQNLIVARRDEGNKVSTILNELSVISQVIQVNRDLKKPVPDIDFKRLKKLNQLKATRQKLRYLSADEENAFLRELDPANATDSVNGCLANEELSAMRQDAFDLAVVLLDTGARYSEIARLPWSAVNLNDKTIELYRNKVKNETRLYMSDRVFQVLKRRSDAQAKDAKWVFTDKHGTGPRKYSPRAFNSALKRAGIEGATIKTMRKTLASKLVIAGVPLFSVSQILGHSTPQTTAMYYASLVPNQASAMAIGVLNDLNKGEVA
jgi:integrase